MSEFEDAIRRGKNKRDQRDTEVNESRRRSADLALRLLAEINKTREFFLLKDGISVSSHSSPDYAGDYVSYLTLSRGDESLTIACNHRGYISAYFGEGYENNYTEPRAAVMAMLECWAEGRLFK